MLYLNIGHSEFQLMPSNKYVSSSVCLSGNKGINHKRIPQSGVWVT